VEGSEGAVTGAGAGNEGGLQSSPQWQQRLDVGRAGLGGRRTGWWQGRAQASGQEDWLGGLGGSLHRLVLLSLRFIAANIRDELLLLLLLSPAVSDREIVVLCLLPVIIVFLTAPSSSPSISLSLVTVVILLV